MGSARTFLLFGFMIALFTAVGWAVGGYFMGDPATGMVVFLVFAALFNAVSYFASDKIVLWSYRAKIVEAHEAPRLHKLMDRLVLKTGMPKPRLALIPQNTPNAFATGRNPQKAVVACTVGILQLLPDDELEGVLAHELAHVKNRDILVMSVAATLAGAIAFAARWAFWGTLFGGGNRDSPGGLAVMLLVAITAPIAALLVQLGISRAREYKADAVGAAMTGNPLSLARALKRLESWNGRVPMEDGNPAHSHLFIVNPFRGGGLAGLFATHPPMEERIRRLENML